MKFRFHFKSFYLKTRHAFQISNDIIKECIFDIDSISFTLDNSANCYICNDRKYFVKFTKLDKNKR